MKTIYKMNSLLAIERISLFVGIFSLVFLWDITIYGFNPRLLIVVTFLTIILNFKKEYFKVGLFSLCIIVLILFHSYLSTLNFSIINRSITASVGLLVITFLCIAKYFQIKKDFDNFVTLIIILVMMDHILNIYESKYHPSQCLAFVNLEWKDLSANSNHANSGSNAPNFVENLSNFNNKSAVRFDGVNDSLVLGKIFDNPIEATGIIVFRETESNTIDRNDALWDIGGHDQHTNHFGGNGLHIYDDFSMSSRPKVVESDVIEKNKVHIYQIENNGTHFKTFVDGLVQMTDTSGGVDFDGDSSIGMMRDANQYKGFFQGEIAEIILFDKVLSDSERTSINDYLTRKWDIPSVDSDGDGIVDQFDTDPKDPNKWMVMPSILRESPSDSYTPMSELELWYDASNTDGENNLSISSGGKIDIWRDLSGKANHVKQSTDSKKPILTTNLNKQYLSFDGSDDSLAGDFAGHILDDPSGQNVTIFTVVKPKGGLYILSSGGQTSHARGYALSYQSGNSYSTFKDQNGDKEISIVNSFIVNQTNLVTHSYKGSFTNVNVLVNGGTESHVNNTRASSSNGFQLLTIGRPNNENSMYFGNFEIAEIIVISSTDSQKVIEIQNYLSNKWSLTESIDSDGDGIVDEYDIDPLDYGKWIDFPNVLRQTETDAHIPIDGLALWLDAKNINGKNNSDLNAGSSVSKWMDLSGNQYHPTGPDSSRLPTLISGGLDFSGDYLSFYDDLSFLKNNSFSIIVVEQSHNSSTNYIFGPRTWGANKGFHFGYREENNFSIAFYSNDAWHSIPNLDSTQTNIISGIYDNSLNYPQRRYIYYNGTKILSNTDSPVTSENLLETNNIDIGRLWAGNWDQYYDGNIKEIIMFDRVLSENELFKIQSYLSAKWQLESIVDSDDDNFSDLIENQKGTSLTNPQSNPCYSRRSISSSSSISIKFHNDFNTVLKMYWLNYSGDLYPMGSINPGQTVSYNTYLTHPWAFVDSQTLKCAAYYDPVNSDNGETINLTNYFDH